MRSVTLNRPIYFLAIAIIASNVQLAGGAVYLYNPGFTNGSGFDADNWIEDSLGDAARQSWGSHDGDGYLMSLPGYTPATHARFYQDVNNITVGYIYSLSFWQDGDGVWNGSNVTARLVWLDNGSNQISSVTTNLDAYTGGSWTEISLDGRAPTNTSYLRIQFDADSPNGGGGAAKFDELILTELPGLFNPGFTNGSGTDADNWIENNLNEATRQSWGSHDGDGWLMALPGFNSGTYGEFYQDLDDITPGHVYSLSFWQEGDAVWNGSNVTAQLIWLDSGSSEISRVSSNLDAYTGGAWTELYIGGKAPDSTSFLRVQFDGKSPSFGGGAAKFDELILTEWAGLLFNPGFSDGLSSDTANADYWVENSLNEATRQSWGSHDGDGWLMALPGYNSGTYGEFHQDIGDVGAGDYYTLSFWQEGDGAWNGSNVTARLIWLDSGSSELSSITKDLDAYTGGSWTNLSIDGIAPADTVRLRIQFDANSPNGGGGAAKFDDLSLSCIRGGSIFIFR